MFVIQKSEGVNQKKAKNQAKICWKWYNPVLSHTEMHWRSIFPFLRLCLSFEMIFSTPWPRSD